MARLTAPLFSLDASGTIGSAITFARWKGINYARVRVIPANPKTTGQTAVRNIFTNLNELWKRSGTLARRPFALAARGQPFTDRNINIRENVPALQGDANLDDLVMSVASGQAINVINVITADGTDGTITVTADSPPAPDGYTLTQVIGVAVQDGDPEDLITRQTYIGEDGGTPWSFAITAGGDADYQVGVHALWTRDSDGLLFCSIADRSQVTVTGS